MHPTLALPLAALLLAAGADVDADAAPASPHRAFHDPAGPYDEEVDAFRRWFRSEPVSGGGNDGVDVRRTEAWGLGVFATSAVRKGDAIVRIREEWVASEATVLRSAESEEERQLYRQRASAGQGDVLVAFLLVERFYKRERSKWHPWLNVLPRVFDTPLQYSEEELRYVEPPVVKRQVLNSRQTAVKAYDELRRRLWFDTDLEEYKWAKCVMATRAWYMNGGVGHLVPVAGMFNHMPDDEDLRFNWRHATPGMRSQKFLDFHKLSKGFATVLSDRDTPAGEQVFESYGDNPTAIYFAFHGFVPASTTTTTTDALAAPAAEAANLYDCFRHSLRDPSTLPLPTAKKKRGDGLTKPAAALSAVQTRYLRGAGLPQEICLHRGEVAPAALLFYAVASLEEGDTARCLGGGGGGGRRGLSREHKRVTACAPRTKLAALALLKAALLHDLATLFTTSIAADESALQGDGGGGHATPLTPAAATAVRYRLEQKRLLKSVTRALSSRIRKLRAAEQEERAEATREAAGEAGLSGGGEL
eukprot:Rhum_TRINITY_DN9255_c0_g1::Rhum_TRINITY_DN9255_c0_g1_i1::g.32545::m.32545/K19199/SETD3; histone-lysine N-methyltransferase SETD3